MGWGLSFIRSDGTIIARTYDTAHDAWVAVDLMMRLNAHAGWTIIMEEHNEDL